MNKWTAYQRNKNDKYWNIDKDHINAKLGEIMVSEVRKSPEETEKMAVEKYSCALESLSSKQAAEFIRQLQQAA